MNPFKIILKEKLDDKEDVLLMEGQEVTREMLQGITVKDSKGTWRTLYYTNNEFYFVDAEHRELSVTECLDRIKKLLG